MRDYLICVTTVGIRDGRCNRCGARIVWALRASPDKPATWLPFTWPKPFPVRQHINGETGIGFEWWAKEKLHFITCPNKRPARKPKHQRPHA